MTLSERRADAVPGELKRLGVPATNLSVLGVGDRMSLVHGTSDYFPARRAFQNTDSPLLINPTISDR